MGRLRDRVVEMMIGVPEHVAPGLLPRIVRRGGLGLRIRALRQMGVCTEFESSVFLRDALSGQAPGVRCAAAWSLGWRGDPSHAPELLRAAALERCDGVRWAMAIGAVRCGAAAAPAWEVIRSGSERTLFTWSGCRQPGSLLGFGLMEARDHWRVALAFDGEPTELPQPIPVASLRAQSLSRCLADPDDRQALMDLAVFQHPDDWPVIAGRLNHQGRRMRHAVTDAMGVHGDPRSVEALLRVLHAVDVDPGHGFSARARAARALGLIGMPTVRAHLIRALDDEALDHEGRPGAGMGIQTSVRTTILAALGEVGASGAADVLAGYLANTTGTACGGFYLAAMDSLVKLDAVGAVRGLLSGSEVRVANGLGVLRAAGRMEELIPWKKDARERVAFVAGD